MELPHWLSGLFGFLVQILPAILWMAFWLFAVDWGRVWPVLARGAWAPCVLLGLVVATVWSRLDTREGWCVPVQLLRHSARGRSSETLHP